MNVNTTNRPPSRNRSAIGGFDESGSLSSGWYWSSSSNDRWDALGQRFIDGLPGNYLKDHPSSVRLVRSPPSAGPQRLKKSASTVPP